MIRNLFSGPGAHLGMSGNIGLVFAFTLPAADGAGSFDQVNSAHLDLSDVLSAVLLADVNFLGRIGTGPAMTEIDLYWNEDALNATYFTVASDCASGDATIVATATQANAVPIGSLLIDETAGKQEVMQVTSVSTVTLSINRAVGDSGPAAEAHAAGARIRIMSKPKQENSKTILDRSVARPRKHNIAQIFQYTYEISRTMMKINLAGVPNEVQHQISMRTLELRRELAMHNYAGVKITAGGAGGSDTVVRSYNGVREFIRANSDMLDTTSTALSPTVVNALYRKIYDKGGDANLIVGTADQVTKFSAMYEDKVRYSPSDRVRGAYVTKYLTDLGVELDLLVDRWCLKGDLMVLDAGRVKQRWLDPFHAEPLGKIGDGMVGQIVGEGSLEFRNAAECGALATALTVG